MAIGVAQAPLAARNISERCAGVLSKFEVATSRDVVPVVALLERAGFLAAPSPQDLDFWFHGERAQ